jgi:hypothetical protein
VWTLLSDVIVVLNLKCGGVDVLNLWTRWRLATSCNLGRLRMGGGEPEGPEEQFGCCREEKNSY